MLRNFFVSLESYRRRSMLFAYPAFFKEHAMRVFTSVRPLPGDVAVSLMGQEIVNRLRRRERLPDLEATYAISTTEGKLILVSCDSYYFENGISRMFCEASFPEGVRAVEICYTHPAPTSQG